MPIQLRRPDNSYRHSQFPIPIIHVIISHYLFQPCPFQQLPTHSSQPMVTLTHQQPRDPRPYPYHLPLPSTLTINPQGPLMYHPSQVPLYIPTHPPVYPHPYPSLPVPSHAIQNLSGIYIHNQSHIPYSESQSISRTMHLFIPICILPISRFLRP